MPREIETRGRDRYTNDCHFGIIDASINTVPETISYKFVTLVLRLGLLAGLIAAGWLVYVKLPDNNSVSTQRAPNGTSLQIVLQPGARGSALDIPLEIYPVDLVAVRDEYFAERRAGKRYEDFMKDRIRESGRSKVAVRLDMQGQTTVVLAPGNWWIHAVLPGNQDLEWRLPVSVAGQKQSIELNPQNAYTRTKTF